MDPTDESILTVDAVAARLGVSRNVVLEAIRRGELRAKKFSNRWGYRIRHVDYDEWLATPSRPKGKAQA